MMQYNHFKMKCIFKNEFQATFNGQYNNSISKLNKKG